MPTQRCVHFIYSVALSCNLSPAKYLLWIFQLLRFNAVQLFVRTWISLPYTIVYLIFSSELHGICHLLSLPFISSCHVTSLFRQPPTFVFSQFVFLLLFRFSYAFPFCFKVCPTTLAVVISEAHTTMWDTISKSKKQRTEAWWDITFHILASLLITPWSAITTTVEGMIRTKSSIN